MIYRYSLILLAIFLTSSLFAGEILDDIVVGGTYNISLYTDNDLEGVVESKDDSTIIIESNGKPFMFKERLIRDYTLISLPKKVKALTDTSIIQLAKTLSYEDVLRGGKKVGLVDVHITNGSVFRGNVSGINQKKIRIDVDGTVVPIAREVIDKIVMVVPEKKEEKIVQAKPSGPKDTVFIVNPETDEYGRPYDPIALVGTVKNDNATTVTIELENGEIKTIDMKQVIRINKNTVESFQDKIKRYAKPLFCPDDMILVDVPPGKPDRPFFKICIDKYEFPNIKGTVPSGSISYSDAQEKCKSQQKRLCTQEEWQWSCSGLEGYVYPYGWNFEKKRCNTKGVGHYEPSGSFDQCVGKFGVYDMVGNIFEWVVGNDDKPMLMGGPYSKCQTASPGLSGRAKPQTGFRCCKSN